MKIQDVSLAAGHRVCGGSEYQWQCWPDAQFMDFTDIDGQEVAGCIYSREDQTVYSAEVHLYEPEFADSVSYRWLNPDWKQAMLDEATQRGVDSANAYDGVQFTDIEDETEFLDLVSRIVHHTYVHAKKVVADETIVGMSPQAGWPFPTPPQAGWPFPTPPQDAPASPDVWDDLIHYDGDEPAECNGCGGGGCCGGCDRENESDRSFSASELDDLEREFNEPKTTWEVTITTKHRLDIEARNYEEVVTKARAFKENVKVHEWGEGVFWMDHWISKETVSKRIPR
jgi:hypothetical protein